MRTPAHRLSAGSNGSACRIAATPSCSPSATAISSASRLPARPFSPPPILVLDDPFASLDPLAVDVMTAVLREQADAGVPVIFSSHELELVEQLCDRVGIIDKGSMIASGTVD